MKENKNMIPDNEDNLGYSEFDDDDILLNGTDIEDIEDLDYYIKDDYCDY